MVYYGIMNNNYNEKGLTKEMVELKSTGMTYKEIGLILGVTRQRVQQIFKPSMKSLIEVSNRTKALCEICGQVVFLRYHPEQRVPNT